MSKRKKLLGCLMLATLLSVGACGNDAPVEDEKKPVEEEKNKYTIKWVNFDGTILETDENVLEGSVPTFDSATPKKNDDEQYSFSFKGWDKEIKAASENVTYKAEFNSTLIKAKVIFDLDGGSSNSKVDYKYVSEIKASEFFFDVTKATYKFVGWSYNGNLVFDKDGNKVSDVEIAETMTFKAVYDHSVTLTVTSSNVNAGTVTGGGTFEYGKTFTVTATAKQGYVFVGWFNSNDVLVSSNASYSSTITGDLTLVGKFKEEGKNLSICSYNENVGLVSFKGSAFAKNSLKEVDPGQSVTVVAQAVTELAQKANFIGWFFGNTKVSSNAEYTFSMPRYNYELVAKWDIYTLTLASNNNEFGTVGQGKKANIGENITLEATAKTGYKFVGWYNGEILVSNEVSYVFEMPANDVTLTAKFEIEEYAVNASVFENNGGSVTGAGTYQSGGSVTLVATPSAGYSFDGWYEGDNKVSSNATYTFIMEHETRNFVAKFTANKYNVGITFDEDKGLVEGEGEYAYGSNVTLKAIPFVGYSFVAWKDANNTVLSEDETYTFQMGAGDIEYKAVFEINTYKVNLINADEDKGSVTGGGTFDYNESITVVATPNQGNVFVGWYDGEQEVSRNASYTFNVPAKEITLTAKFDVESYLVTAVCDAEQKGSITGAGRYKPGTTVTLVATSNTGYTFEGWYNGDIKVQSEPTLEFTMGAEDVDYVAKFTANVHNVYIDYNSTMGSVQGAGSHSFGEKINLVATPNEGYEFVAWKDSNDEVISNIFIYVLTMGDNDAHVKAEFKPIKYDVTVTSENEEMGSVSGTGNYDFNSSVTVVATPEDGYMFIGWYDGEQKVSEDASYTFNVPAKAVNFVAKFMPDNHREVVVTSEDTKKGTVTGSGTYIIDEEVTVKATANTGYTFEGWYNGDEKVSGTSEYKFTVPDGNVTLVAKFTINVHSVSVACDDEMGTVTGDGDYEYSSEVTITATAKQGFIFDHWEDASGNEFSEYAECMFGMVDEDLELTAVFVQRKYKINASSEDETMGTVTGGGEFYYGESVTMTATANEGYKFIGWYDDQGKVSDDLSYTVDVDYADANYTAKFKLDNERELTLTSNDENKGTVAGGRIYKIGEEVTVEATPEYGYHFVGWYDGDTLVSTEWQYTFTMPDREFKLVGKFEGNVHTVTVNFDDEACTVTGAGEYHYGDTVTLTIECEGDYYFVEWANSGDDRTLSDEETYSFVLEDKDYVIDAVVQMPTVVFYDLTLSVNNEEAGTVVDEFAFGSYGFGEIVAITAYPNENYVFVGWYDGDELVSTDEYYEFFMPDGPYELTAVFKSTIFTATITSEDEDKGIVSGSGTYSTGDVVTITATAKEGFEFAGWYDGDTLVYSEATYVFDMPDDDVNYEAKFNSLTHNVLIVNGDEEKGEVSGEGPCLAGEDCTIVATPKDGYHFVGWFEEGELVSEDESYTFTMPNNDVVYEARFEINTYQVNATCLYEIEGLYDFEGLYSYGDTFTLSFDSDKVPVNLEFLCWKIGDETIYEESIEITVEGDLVIELVFVEI